MNIETFTELYKQIVEAEGSSVKSSEVIGLINVLAKVDGFKNFEEEDYSTWTMVDKKKSPMIGYASGEDVVVIINGNEIHLFEKKESEEPPQEISAFRLNDLYS